MSFPSLSSWQTNTSNDKVSKLFEGTAILTSTGALTSAASTSTAAVPLGLPSNVAGAIGRPAGEKMMGAYLVLFPRVRVRMLFIFLVFFRVFPLPAWMVLLWWFGLQLLMGLPELGAANAQLRDEILCRDAQRGRGRRVAYRLRRVEGRRRVFPVGVLSK